MLGGRVGGTKGVDLSFLAEHGFIERE